MDSTVKLRIKIDGNFKEVEVAADDLADAVKRIKQETKDLESGLINSNQIAQAFEQAGAAVQSLQSVEQQPPVLTAFSCARQIGR